MLGIQFPTKKKNKKNSGHVCLSHPEVELRVHWVFCWKLNSQQPLLETFFSSTFKLKASKNHLPHEVVAC